MQEVIEIIFECLGILLGSFVLTLMPKVKAFIEAKVEAKQDENTYELIKKFVRSAEQTIVGGEDKKAYVIGRLKTKGIELTAEINDYIESAVKELF